MYACIAYMHVCVHPAFGRLAHYLFVNQPREWEDVHSIDSVILFFSRMYGYLHKLKLGLTQTEHIVHTVSV